MDPENMMTDDETEMLADARTLTEIEGIAEELIRAGLCPETGADDADPA